MILGCRVAFEDRAGCCYRIERNNLVRDLSYSRMSSPGTPHFNKLSRHSCLCAFCECVRRVYVCSYLICTVSMCAFELLIILVVRNFHVQPDISRCIYLVIYMVICTCLLIKSRSWSYCIWTVLDPLLAESTNKHM